MSLAELFLIALALSMDAFAVAIAKGLQMKRINYRHAAVVALFFGIFQAIMPLLGWLLGTSFQVYIESFDHWVAFVLLAFIGGKMILESFDADEAETDYTTDRLKLGKLTVLALATSIDALAAGITFAVLPNTNIWTSIALIGCTTLVLSFVGVCAGNRLGAKYKKRAELFGGVVLVLIGLKILLEHLGVISF